MTEGPVKDRRRAEAQGPGQFAKGLIAARQGEDRQVATQVVLDRLEGQVLFLQVADQGSGRSVQTNGDLVQRPSGIGLEQVTDLQVQRMIIIVLPVQTGRDVQSRLGDFVHKRAWKVQPGQARPGS